MTTGLKEAILECFSWESLGAGLAGLRCRAGGAAGEASMFAETVGLDDSFDFFPEKNPDLGAGSAGLRCRAGAAGWRTPECQEHVHPTCDPTC